MINAKRSEEALALGDSAHSSDTQQRRLQQTLQTCHSDQTMQLESNNGTQITVQASALHGVLSCLAADLSACFITSATQASVWFALLLAKLFADWQDAVLRPILSIPVQTADPEKEAPESDGKATNCSWEY